MTINNFEIDEAERKAKGRPRQWPFLDMKAGESVMVATSDDKKVVRCARSAASYAAKKMGAEFQLVTYETGNVIAYRNK